MQQSVRAAQSGDASAWTTLYRQHYPWLYATALRICGNCSEAKDAVQDTFIQAYMKLHQLKDINALPAWLKTILVRCCYSYLQPNLLTDFPPESNHFCEDGINHKLDNYAQQTKLYEVLARLPETLRSVVLLRYFSAYKSYGHMAKILCIPVGTIRSRLNEARKKMTENWHKNNMDNERFFKEAGEWNHFYSNYFGTVHCSLDSRERFIGHLDKHLHLVFTSGQTAYGREFIEKEIADDISYGSRFGDIEVMTSGTLSVVEVSNINSEEHPTRCPDSSIFVIYRNQNKVTKLHLHNSIFFQPDRTF